MGSSIPRENGHARNKVAGVGTAAFKIENTALDGVSDDFVIMQGRCYSILRFGDVQNQGKNYSSELVGTIATGGMCTSQIILLADES